jgi:putative addiction module killer protein
MIEILETGLFVKWFERLRDREARARISIRIRRLSLGNPGDVRAVGEGVSELRIHHGPGYRIYYMQRGDILLLAGGIKKTQQADIGAALELARRIREHGQ